MTLFKEDFATKETFALAVKKTLVLLALSVL